MISCSSLASAWPILPVTAWLTLLLAVFFSCFLLRWIGPPSLAVWSERLAGSSLHRHLEAASSSASAWRILLGIHLVLCTPVLSCCRLLAGPAASAELAGPELATTLQRHKHLIVFFQHWPHIGIPTFLFKGASLSQCIKKTMTACMLSCITVV